MTETSYFWDDTLVGDATLARYDSLEFLQLFRHLVIGQGGYIVPEFNNNLQVVATSPASANVTLQSGAAVIRNRFYDNDSDLSLTIAANASGNPRIDSVILTSNVAAQTVRASILQGTAAASPQPPTLTQTTATYQIRVANIWVANGFATITDNEIYYVADYLPTVADMLDKAQNRNLLLNSEYLAWGTAINGVVNTTNLPLGWNSGDFYSQPVSQTKDTKYTNQEYGVSLGVLNTTASDIDLTTYVQINPSTDYVVRIPIKVDVGLVSIDIADMGNGVAESSLATYTARPTGDWEVITLHVTSRAGTDLLKIYFDTNGGPNNEDFAIGQIVVRKGFYVGPFEHVSETLIFNFEGRDATWEAGVSSTLGAPAVLLPASHFTDILIPGVQGVYWYFEFNNATGGAADISVQIGSVFMGTNGRITFRDVPAGDTIYGNFWTPLTLRTYESPAETNNISFINSTANAVTIKLRIVGITT